MEALGDEFRRGVGDPGGHAGFGAGEVLDLVGGAAEGEELQVQAVVLTALVVHRGLVPGGDVWQVHALAVALVEEGVAALQEAKAAHDRLESVYNPYVDFDGVRAQAALEAGRLLSWMQ